jgi:hypothetical protein
VLRWFSFHIIEGAPCCRMGGVNGLVANQSRAKMQLELGFCRARLYWHCAGDNRIVGPVERGDKGSQMGVVCGVFNRS